MIHATVTFSGRVSDDVPASRIVIPVGLLPRPIPVPTVSIWVQAEYPFPDDWVAWICTPPPTGSGDQRAGEKP